MNREVELRLIDTCLANARDKTIPRPGREVMVPVDRYLDAAHFEKEMTGFFRNHLNFAAHSTQLPEPGSFLTTTVGSVPVLISRNAEGKVQAFLNVCRHRGATLERRERGQCKRFVCPYHAWTYDLDGHLVHLRHREGFPTLDVASVSLKALVCEEYRGFIFVGIDPKQVDLELDEGARRLIDEIAEFDFGELAAYRVETHELAANWKLLVEGGLESYHFKIAHRDTIGGLFSDTASIFERVGRHMRSVLPRTTLAKLDPEHQADWKLVQHANVLYTLNPNASILVQDGHYGVIRMDPLAVDRTRVTLMTVGRTPNGPSAGRIREFLEANHAFTVKTLMEDFVLGEEIQRGLQSGANAQLRLASYEAALEAWHEVLDADVPPPPKLALCTPP